MTKLTNPFALANNGKYALASNGNEDPSSRQRLLKFTREAGVDLEEMQGSTANLFDTAIVADKTTPQTLEFFRGTTNKVNQFTNFQKDLKVGEAIGVRYIQLTLLTLTSDNLTLNTTRIVTAEPLAQTPASIPFSSGSLRFMTANGTRIKNFVLTELEPWNNPINCGIALTNQAATGETLHRIGANYILLEAEPIALPNNDVYLALEVGPLNGLPANSAVKVTVGRYGSIYKGN